MVLSLCGIILLTTTTVPIEILRIYSVIRNAVISRIMITYMHSSKYVQTIGYILLTSQLQFKIASYILSYTFYIFYTILSSLEVTYYFVLFYINNFIFFRNPQTMQNLSILYTILYPIIHQQPDRPSLARWRKFSAATRSSPTNLYLLITQIEVYIWPAAKEEALRRRNLHPYCLICVIRYFGSSRHSPRANQNPPAIELSCGVTRRWQLLLSSSLSEADDDSRLSCVSQNTSAREENVEHLTTTMWS